MIFKIKVRKFKKQDVKKLCNIIKDNNIKITSKFYPKKLIKYWNEKVINKEYILKRKKKRIYLILEHNTKVIGFINFEKNVLKSLFIDFKFHKKGFGTFLIKKAEKIIKRNGYSKIIVKSNTNTEKFYKKLGFKRKKIIYKIMGKIKMKKILMEKILN